MKKYIYILKSEIMSSLQYVPNIIIHFISFLIIIFIFLNLWQYIYSDPEEIINGYTINQMVWYVIVTEILWFILGGRRLCRSISNDIKTGNIVYQINKPYGYIGYTIASHGGRILLNGIVYSILATVLGIILLKEFPQITILGIIIVFITGILATVINMLFTSMIGMISFVIEDSVPLYWLYSKLILIMGTLFPIEFFPVVLQKYLRYSPIFAMSYGPAKLFVNFNWNDALIVAVVQIIYLIISYSICKLIYKKGVRKLNVNGG